MNIPESFRCAGLNIKVEILDKLPSNNFGEYCDATNTISIGRKVDVEGKGEITLSDEHIINTFFHELIHVWQFYYDNHYSEAQAQSFANFMGEFFRTKKDNLPF